MMTMWILGAVFALVGAPLVWIARRAMVRDGTVARWPRTEGVVIRTLLKTSTHRHREKTGLEYDRTMYTPLVWYTYSIDGQRFEGTGIARSIDGVLTAQTTAQAVLDRYPPEKQVAVMYDPADHKASYLEAGDSVGAIILLVFGCFWIALGTLLVALSFA